MFHTALTRNALTALTLACSLAPFGCAVDSSADENVATDQQGIVDGLEEQANTFGTAALYHMKQKDPDQPAAWWGRPCSARVLNPTEAKKAVLTARHCITLNGEPTGPVLNTPSQLRITTALRPGPTRPSYAVKPFAVHDHPDADLERQRDIAVVWVEGDIQLPSTTALVGMNVVKTEELTDGVPLIQLGYGWGTLNDNSSTGVLRSAYFFEISSVGPNATYSYLNVGNQSGGSINHGDSGGPAIFTNATGPSFNSMSVAHTQTGVHARLETHDGVWWGYDASVADNWDKFLMPELGAIYIRSLFAPNRRINVSTTLDSPAKTEPNTTSSGHSMLTYSVKTGQIGIRNNPERTSGNSGRCLAIMNGQIVVRNCSAQSNQDFRMTTDSQLKNLASGKCVQENSSHRLVLASCTTDADRRWIVDPDPR